MSQNFIKFIIIIIKYNKALNVSWMITDYIRVYLESESETMTERCYCNLFAGLLWLLDMEKISPAMEKYRTLYENLCL